MEKKLSAIMWLAAMVIVVPFFGIPLAAKQWVLALAGISIGVIVFLLRGGQKDKEGGDNGVYTENKPVELREEETSE